MRALPRSHGFGKQSGLFSISSEPHYLELYQTWGRCRDRAVPRPVRERLLAAQISPALAA